MFQKYVPDVITSYKRHIFFLEQIHIHMVFSRYKYGSDANKCGVRTFVFIKKSHFFQSIFPKNQPKFDLFLNICLTSVFTKITFCWILQILTIFQYTSYIFCKKKVLVCTPRRHISSEISEPSEKIQKFMKVFAVPNGCRSCCLIY